MKYWWIIANDRWNWIKDQKIDEIEPWPAKTEKGSIKKKFKQVKFGDKVIGYQSGKSKAVVAIGIIEQALYENANFGKCIDIRKTKELREPISLEELRKISPFDKKFEKNISLNGTILPLDENEYNIIMGLEKKIFFDDDDRFEDIIKILEADDTVTKAEPKPRPELESYSLNLWKRTPQYSKEALNKTKFVCELEDEINTHNSFISQITKCNYVEAHHLIPMKEQYNFTNSLDVPGNIIALCPNCHKLLHLGESKVRIENIIKLYKQRKEILEEWGICITEQALKDIYK